jgi:maltooligosyltrehalose trehalohydrolase
MLRLIADGTREGTGWTATRRLPIGAEVQPGGGVHFRVWAPKRRTVEVVLEGGPGAGAVVPLAREEGGYHAGFTPAAAAGTRYRFRLDGGDYFYPDPASRFQPDGPHGPSEVIDPSAFRWTDHDWPGVRLPGQVIYELHVGTFTEDGTWAAAERELPALADLGVTVVEVMPVADFPGRFGWGYDGVDLFAPHHLYGTPDDFRRFVDAAHRHGLGVILDVVYNHLGPDGNYLRQFADDYFTDRYDCEWGDAVNFDGPTAGPVREFFVANAGYWIDEFHLDGLRIDATQQIFDRSPDHVLAAIARRTREAAGRRSVLLVAENEPQHTKLARPPERGGYGLDALWNDDFHHTAMVALTDRNEAYYTDYLGAPQEFISAAKYGYLYQGQWYRWQRQRRGTPGLDLPPAAFVNFVQNHDQVANSGRGFRAHVLTSPGRLRAVTACLLLFPGTPMLFQGQEFAASSPFFYFADHHPELARAVAVGRTDFLRQFRSVATPEVQAVLPLPADSRTFERCKLDHAERQRHAEVYALYKDLLRLRRDDRVFRAQTPRGVDGAVLSEHAFVLRYFGDGGDDRLLVVNLGRDLHLNPAPEPLLAPPEGKVWAVRWSSEDLRYGGCGTAPLDTEDNWRIPGAAAVVLAPAEPGGGPAPGAWCDGRGDAV